MEGKYYTMRVTGNAEVFAKNEEQALLIFEDWMKQGFTVMELRCKEIELFDGSDRVCTTSHGV